MLWQWSYKGGWQTLLAWGWMNQRNRKCKGRKILPTCVMTMAAAAGLLEPLLSLAALVPDLCGTAPVGLRQQRGNGLPQRLGLELGGRVVLFLDVRWRFLWVQALRQRLSGSRGLDLGLIRGLVSFSGLLLRCVLGVWLELVFLHLRLTTALWDQNQIWKHERQKREDTNQLTHYQ